MKEKPLCGYCYKECTDDCCDKRRIDVLERQLAEVMTGLTLIESSLINLRPRDKSPIDRRFGDLIKDIVQLKEKG